MTSCSLPRCGAIAALTLLCLVSSASMAAAQERQERQDREGKDATTSEAGKHFRHGVQLYSEADYAAALVEFKRAYALVPSSAALYNIGETQYQLQDYAAALKTFQRFLGEFGPGEAHRSEVEQNVEVLRTRVGHVMVTTSPQGADLSLDDQPVGKTPLPEPLLVSVGHRKVVASMTGRPSVTKYVDVAAEDNVSISLQLPPPPEGKPVATAPAAPDGVAAPPVHAPVWPIVGYVTAGVLAAGAGTMGVLAISESNALKNARNAFPATSATINHDASLTRTYSVIADSLALGAIAVGGMALFGTLSSSPAEVPGATSHPQTQTSAPRAQVTLGPASARLEMTF